ncbi:MAG: DUF4349 domain-containing protein [Candidatus Limnocylindrales bacterium]
MITTLGRALRRTLRPALIIPLLLILFVAACASSGGAARAPVDNAGAGAPAAQPAPVPDQAGGDTKSSGSTDTGNGSVALAQPVDQALIVKTGALQLEVGDVSATLVKARTVVAGFGGYVSDSQQSLDGDQPVASITYRVPAARWDEAINALKGLGDKILSEKTEAVEVTGQVLDLGARIDNLRATERALQAIMVKAVKISDILEVQQQLTTVQGQIEQLSTEKAHLEAQAAYGTLTVGFQAPVVPVTTSVTKDWSLGDQVDHALAVLVQVGQGLATAAVWFVIVVLPFLLVGLLALAVVVLVGRRVAARSTPGGPFGPTTGPDAPAA